MTKRIVLALVVLTAALAAAQTAPTHSVDLTWNASPEPGAGLGYNLYRSGTAGTGYGKVNLVPIVGLAFTDTGVVTGQSYFYVVRASLNSRESVNSNEAQAVILPFPPSGLSATQH